LIDEERKRYIHASIAFGAIGCLLFYILSEILKSEFIKNPGLEGMFGLFGAIMVGTLMLAFMNISGFKAR
jgi:hypothetical protein